MPTRSAPQYVRELARTSLADFEKAVGAPQEEWRHECHAVSIAVVKSDVIKGPARVARGSALGVNGQHSWVVLGNDCYDPSTWILDLTLWSYVEGAPVRLVKQAQDKPWVHKPHGSGTIFSVPMPSHTGGETIELTPSKPLGVSAQHFLDLIGPLDLRGWNHLIHSPVLGWPAKEILSAVLDTDQLKAFVPIDIAGMVTDRNPSGLYLRPSKPSTTNPKDPS